MTCHKLLKIDAECEADRISEAIRNLVLGQFRKKGAVLGISGGIDSSVVASLCVRALGADHVLALLMPEVESSQDSLSLGRELAEFLAIRSELIEITPALEALDCYRRRDDAIRMVCPEYGPGYKCKIVLPDQISSDQYAIFSVLVRSPAGVVKKFRLSLESYLGIVAASNLKQRTRKMVEYYYADRAQYVVAGTPNRLEYELGFFVKAGDGAADMKPIAHLYKSQVYQLADYLNIPLAIQQRTPTTDTYPLEQTQEEFYFSMPLFQMDLCLYGRNHSIPPDEFAAEIGIFPDQVRRAYAMIDRKRQMAQYLHAPAMTLPLGMMS